MSSEEERELGWLVRPSEPGTVNVYIDLGEGATITPEIRKTIETLVEEVSKRPASGPEEGFPIPIPSCRPFKVQNPCRVLATCKIGTK